MQMWVILIKILGVRFLRRGK